MKKINSIILAAAFVLGITFAGSALGSNAGLSVNAQDSMLGKVGDKITKTTKTVYKKGRRVGTTVGTKTWDGTKWVASKSWKGGKWVAVKTVNGTKWVYRRGRNAVRGAQRPTP